MTRSEAELPFTIHRLKVIGERIQQVEVWVVKRKLAELIGRKDEWKFKFPIPRK